MTNLPKKFYYKKNRLQQLKGFYHTVQSGSISKAAIDMGLNQSTVTLQIQALERDLQTKLLERHSKPIKLTKDGKSLYEMAAHHLQGIDSLYEEFLANKSSDRQIKIAADCNVINHLLPKVLNKFCISHPKIKLVIKYINLDLAVEELKSNKVDFIIYPNINLSNQFSVKHYRTADPILIINKNHPLAKKKKISVEEIGNYNLIQSDNWIFDSNLKKMNIKNNIYFENAGSDLVKLLVKSNIGIGLISSICVKKIDLDLICKNFGQYFSDIDYKIAYKSSEATIKEIIDLIIDTRS